MMEMKVSSFHRLFITLTTSPLSALPGRGLVKAPYPYPGVLSLRLYDDTACIVAS